MEQSIFNVIAKALEVDATQINLKTTSNDLEEWDSLGHLSLLMELDKAFNDVSEKAPQLASASTVKEIVDAVTEYS
jgi:acyl carrier protein